MQAGKHTHTIREPFDKALKLIRRALAEADLSVVGEFDATGTFGRKAGRKSERSTILLVDCPILAFEAQALDRAARVFFPLHVFVWSEGDRTRLSTMGFVDLFDVRLPSGAAQPIGKLQARIAAALETVLTRPG